MAANCRLAFSATIPTPTSRCCGWRRTCRCRWRAYIGVGAATTAIPRRIALRLELEQATGARLLNVDQAGPAAHAGLLSGDIVIGLDGKTVTSVAELLRALDAEKINRTVPVDVLRRSERLRVWIGPVERPLVT